MRISGTPLPGIPETLKGGERMTNYTQGEVLAAATMLPVTAGAGIVLMDNANAVVVAALIAVNMVSLALTASVVSRYLANRKKS